MGTKAGASASCPAVEKLGALANSVEIRNSFSALSGASDEFTNSEDLCRNLSDGLYFDSQMLPTLDLSDSGRGVLMNAAVYDYLVHGYQNVNGVPSRKFLFE